MMPDKKPALAILIGDALAKKGMIKSGSKEEAEPEEGGDHDEYLQEIADDMMKAIKEEDSKAFADLLKEAFFCLDAMPHKEGPHEDEDESY